MKGKIKMKKGNKIKNKEKKNKNEKMKETLFEKQL